VWHEAALHQRCFDSSGSPVKQETTLKSIIQNTDYGYYIELSDMTQDQANQVQALVNTLLFPVVEELDSFLGVPVSKAKAIINHINNGYTLSTWPDTEGQPNKINDIKYVRAQSNSGLKEAKDFVEKHFYYSSYSGIATRTSR
jgi:hypothetical protein